MRDSIAMDFDFTAKAYDYEDANVDELMVSILLSL